MLALTPAAVAVVKHLTTTMDTPNGAGLRISSDTAPVEGGLQVELTPGPAERDEVRTESGARLFLAPDLGAFLDDKVLDAKVDDQGGAHFMLGTQGTNGNHPES